jgi:hypothetical protein
MPLFAMWQQPIEFCSREENTTMGDIAMVVIAVALVWIAWELHRFSQIVVNLMTGWEDAIARKKSEEGN